MFFVLNCVFLVSNSESIEISFNKDTATPLIPNVSVQMLFASDDAEEWFDGIVGRNGTSFVYGSGTAEEETYDLYTEETNQLRYIDLPKYTRMKELENVVGVNNSLADQRRPSGKGYTSKDLISEGGDLIQGAHGDPSEVHRNMLLCLRHQNGLVASNSDVAAEQLSALAMLGLATGVYPGPRMETDGVRSGGFTTYATPFIRAQDGHIANDQRDGGAFRQLLPLSVIVVFFVGFCSKFIPLFFFW